MREAWLLVLALLPAPGVAVADGRMAGWVAAEGVVASDPIGEDERVAGARAHLEGSWRGEAGSARLVLEHPSDDQLGDNSQASLVREAWLRERFDALDVTVGRQLLPEGRSDWIRVQGQFAPRDFSQIGIGDAEQRLGLPALRASVYSAGALVVTAALVYQDRGNLLPAAVVRRSGDLQPLQDEPRWGGSLRMEWHEEGWEAGATVADVASPWPVLRPGDAGRPAAGAFRQRMAALDGTASVAGSVLRWDVACAENDAGEFPGVPSRMAAGMLGADTGLWPDARLSAQVISAWSPSGTAAAGLVPASLEQANRFLLQLYMRDHTWVTLNLYQDLGARYRLEAGGLFRTQRTEYGTFVQLTARLRDDVRLGLRYQAAGGAADGIAASAIAPRLGVVELRYQF